MKKIIAVLLSAVVVFSLSVFCVSANEENGFDNFLDAFLNAMVALTENSDAQMEDWDDVLDAAKNGAADSVGDDAESYALTLDEVSAALSEYSEEEFESWNDIITYGSESLITDLGISKTELFDAFKAALENTDASVNEDITGFNDLAAGVADTGLEDITSEINEFIELIKSFLKMFAEYIVELTETLNWYSDRK